MIVYIFHCLPTLHQHYSSHISQFDHLIEVEIDAQLQLIRSLMRCQIVVA